MRRKTIKESGNRLQNVCYGNDIWKHENEIVVIENICAELAMSIIDFEDKAAKYYGDSRTVDFIAEVTGYTKKEVKDILKFTARIRGLFSEDILDAETLENPSTSAYTMRIIKALLLIRTKFPIYLWTGVILCLIERQTV
jgi:hypothetical protein|nr:MAG TPA: hypothetical protein [Caudoviricetes sp.]